MLSRVLSVTLFTLQGVRTLAISTTIFSTTANTSAKSSLASLAVFPLLLVSIFVFEWFRKGWQSNGYVPVLIGSILSHTWLMFVFGFG